MAPALSGPTCSTPKRSTRAIVPPPALTVLMSIIGTAMSRPSTLPRLATNGSPSLISATAQEVPPNPKGRMGAPAGEGVDVGKAGRGAGIGAGGAAAGRSRQHGGHRLAGGGGKGGHAAV